MEKIRLTSAMFLLVLNSAFLSACAKPNQHVAAAEDKRPIVGDLAPAVEQLSSGKHLGACDRVNLSKITEIARAVDQHKADIDSYIASLSQTQGSKNFKYIQMGPILIRENAQDLPPTPGWQTTTSSWKEIFQDYETVLSNPTPKNWSIINTAVRGILTDDQSRIVDGYSYTIGYADEPIIQGLMDGIQKCEADTTCTQPTFPTEGMAWLLKQPDYPEFLDTLKKSTGHSASATTLATFERYLKMDHRRFEMRKNEKITRNGSVLTLPLYAGVFSGVTEQLSKYIESVWKSPTLSLQIDWKPASPDLFTMLLSPDKGGRSYVLYKTKQVVLFNAVKAKSIAHEIGHVIGLQDHYFEVWDESQCEYITQYRNDDLMSDATFGQVTDDEWKTLQTTYP